MPPMSYQQSHPHTINQSKVMLAVRYQCWDFHALCNQCATYDLPTPKHLIDICFSSHVTRIQVLLPWPLTQRPYMWNPKASLSLHTSCKPCVRYEYPLSVGSLIFMCIWPWPWTHCLTGKSKHISSTHHCIKHELPSLKWMKSSLYPP